MSDLTSLQRRALGMIERFEKRVRNGQVSFPTPDARRAMVSLLREWREGVRGGTPVEYVLGEVGDLRAHLQAFESDLRQMVNGSRAPSGAPSSRGSGKGDPPVAEEKGRTRQPVTR